MSRKRFKFDVDTASNCFICSDEVGNGIELFPLQNIFRYLKISFKNIETLSTKPKSLLNKTEIRVNLCQSCGKTVQGFSELYQTLELIKMRINYNTEIIQDKLLNSAKNSNLLRDYKAKISQNCESKSLRHFKLVEEMRQEIMQKCKDKLSRLVPKVRLKHVTFTETTTFTNSIANPDMKYMTTSVKLEDSVNKAEADFVACSTDSDEDIQETASVAPSSSSDADAEDLQNTRNVISESELKKVKCPYPSCNFKFRHRKSANIHYQAVHLNIRYKCEKCGAEFTQRTSLTRHKIKCANQVKQETEKVHQRGSRGSRRRQNSPFKYLFDEVTRNFKCSVESCPKQFKTKAMCYHHYFYSHKSSGLKTFPCHDSTCSRLFNTAKGAKLHYESVHLKLRYECDKCQASFTQAQGLKKHKTTSCSPPSNSEPDTSPGAQKVRISFQNQKYVADPTKKKYKCDDANYQTQFASRKTARNHFRTIHLKIRHECPGCSQQFAFNTNLSRHKKICLKILKKEAQSAGFEEGSGQQNDSNSLNYTANCYEDAHSLIQNVKIEPDVSDNN